MQCMLACNLLRVVKKPLFIRLIRLNLNTQGMDGKSSLVHKGAELIIFFSHNLLLISSLCVNCLFYCEKEFAFWWGADSLATALVNIFCCKFYVRFLNNLGSTTLNFKQGSNYLNILVCKWAYVFVHFSDFRGGDGIF